MPLREVGRKGPQSEQPLVSIITATFNDAGALRTTAQSIRESTYRNIEWVVIDGGSDDGTVDVIRQNADIVGYWVSEPDRGIYDAWNKGVTVARGSWISFLGAGDRYHADALDRYVSAIGAANPIPLLATSRVRHVDSSGKVLRVWGSPFDSGRLRKLMNIGHCGALHHKSLFERFGPFDISYRSASDYEFLMRCCRGELRAIYVDMAATDMLVGGISTGYRGLVETYHIQKRYGEGRSAVVRLLVACAKRFVRPMLRGY